MSPPKGTPVDRAGGVSVYLCLSLATSCLVQVDKAGGSPPSISASLSGTPLRNSPNQMNVQDGAKYLRLQLGATFSRASME